MIEITEELAKFFDIKVGETLVLHRTESGTFYLGKMELSDAFENVNYHRQGMTAVSSVNVFLRLQ